MCMMASFEAMVAESDKRGMPHSYVKDLYYHDRNRLEYNKPNVFGWALRDLGTHLFLPTARDVEWFDACIKVYPDCLLYWWNGHILEPVCASELRLLLITHAR